MTDTTSTPDTPSPGAGPLAGIKVIETGGIGPNPFAGMFLAELGAEVVRVDRPSAPDSFAVDPLFDLLNRGKRSIVLDLRQAGAVAALLAMVERADVLTEGFRPGVMERLGLGPQECWQRNPRLVYGRMTGWGQDGPLSPRAGHDINYIGVTGVLEAIGEAGRPPQIPLTVIGDFAGGANYLVIGVLAALRAAERTGVGQVVDAAIVDGTSHLLTAVHALINCGSWTVRRQHNIVDGAAPFYAVYETSDHRYMAVGAIERQFYRALLSVLDLDEDPSRQYDPATWPPAGERIAAAFRTRTQAEWAERFAGTDACVSPVVSLTEAAENPQISARGSVRARDGQIQPAPAPRFSSFEPPDAAPPPRPGQHTREVLSDWGVPGAEALIASGAAVQAQA
jgi:alpha-methylacyl-CoA racemase